MNHSKVTHNKQYGRCVDCDTRRIVRRREWDRAQQPRCYACGGRIEPCGGKSGELHDDLTVASIERKAIYDARQP